MQGKIWCGICRHTEVVVVPDNCPLKFEEVFYKKWHHWKDNGCPNCKCKLPVVEAWKTEDHEETHGY